MEAQSPQDFARFAALDMTWGFPGGERFADQQQRVLAGVADWRARGIDGPVLVICHGNTIRVALLGLADPGRPVPRPPANGSMIEL